MADVNDYAGYSLQDIVDELEDWKEKSEKIEEDRADLEVEASDLKYTIKELESALLNNSFSFNKP